MFYLLMAILLAISFMLCSLFGYLPITDGKGWAGLFLGTMLHYMVTGMVLNLDNRSRVAYYVVGIVSVVGGVLVGILVRHLQERRKKK